MREIILNLGKVALIDTSDYVLLSTFNWFAQPNKNDTGYYAVANISYGHIIYMHRILLGAQEGDFVDHWDYDGLNNQRYNIRICTPQENAVRQRPRIDGTSNYKGVSWNTRTNRWVAGIRVSGTRVHLGYFDTELDAAIAYNLKAAELYPGLAYLNKVTNELFPY